MLPYLVPLTWLATALALLALPYARLAAADTLTIAGGWVFTVASKARPRRIAKMPRRHPRIAHFMPYLIGDALTAPARAARLGFAFIDMNGNADADDCTWIVHWDRFRIQFGWYWTGELDAKGREVRARVPASWPKYLHLLHSDQVELLRSAKRGGKRPRRAMAAMRACAEAGVIMCLEVKNSPAYLRARAWTLLGQCAAISGATVIPMTLQNLSRKGHPEDPWVRLKLAHHAGHFPDVAILPRGKAPASVPDYVAVWGSWRR